MDSVSITEITRQRAVSERLRDDVSEREARFQKVSICLTIYPLCCLSGMLIHVSMIQLKLHRNSNIEEKYIALKNTLDDISMVPMISECSFQNIKSHGNKRCRPHSQLIMILLDAITIGVNPASY